MPKLTVTMGNQTVWHGSFGSEGIRIGRAPENDVIIGHLSVARRHARIVYQDGYFRLISTSPSAILKINGISCRSGVLQDGDILSIGRHRALFDLGEPLESLQEGDDSVQKDAEGARPNLVLSSNGGMPLAGLQRFPQLSLGRSPWARISMADWFLRDFELLVSAKGASFHARSIGDGFFWLNEARCTEAELQDGDEMRIGSHTFKISVLTMAGQENEIAVEGPIPADADCNNDGPLEGTEGESFEGGPTNPSFAFVPPADAMDCEEIQNPAEMENGTCWPQFDPSQGNPGDEKIEDSSATIASPEEESAIKITMLEKALSNKSLAVRKHAALQLKRLTGRDYEP